MRRRRFYHKSPARRFAKTAPRPVLKPEADGKLKGVFSQIGIPDPRPFKPDRFQKTALAVVEHDDCLVTAPTGAGKTWIAEQAILRIRAMGKKAWYASPLKALSNSKYAEFSKRFGSEALGILTGDRRENPEAPIIVGTTEILRNQLYDAMHHGITLDTDFVVLDEAHFLGDPERGVVWEEIMIYLPERIPMLMLSATVGNAHELAAWLSSIRHRNCTVVEEKKRPVPLVPLFLDPSGTLFPLLSQRENKGKPKLYKKISGYLSSPRAPRFSAGRSLPPFGQILGVLRHFHLLPAIFFLKSRADCDAALELCLDNRLGDADRKTMLQDTIEAMVMQSPRVSNHRQRWHLENFAVGAHHSGQLPTWKMILETLMTAGLLDAVFATSTVAAGVNFPARTVVFLNSDRFNGQQFLPLTPTEFHQMTGRAGRRGMDRIGFAVAVPGKFMDLRWVVKLVDAEPMPVLSQIRINFSMVLNLLLSHTPDQIHALLENSFAAYLLANKKKNRPGFQRPSTGRFLWEDFVRHLDFLKANGFVGEDGQLTDDGRWASRLRIDQPLMVAEGLRLDVLPASDPPLLAALVAAFVSDRDFDDRLGKRTVPKPLLRAFLRMRKGLRPLGQDLDEKGFQVKPLFLKPAAAVYAWASGQDWDAVRTMYEIEEGDLAMLILRTADNLRHIQTLSETFAEASRSAGHAIEGMLREPVRMDYQ